MMMNLHEADDVKSETVFIVDDDDSIRTSLSRLLKLHGYSPQAYGTAREFLDFARLEEGVCLILDLQMPEMSGIELQRHLANYDLNLPIIFLTAQGDVPSSVQAMKQGALDFLPKMSDRRELLKAVETAAHVSAELKETAQLTKDAKTAAANLTKREMEVCRFVARGMLNKQIATTLGIAERTVKAHRAKVMEKFGARSLPDLVRAADRAGITSTD